MLSEVMSKRLRVSEATARTMAVAIGLVIGFWIFDAFLDTYWLDDGNLGDELLDNPGGHDLWMRTTTAALILAFGLYVSAASGWRRKADQALRRSEARFRTLADSTFEGIAISERGDILDGNEQLAMMLGVERASDLVGRRVLDFVARESRDEVEQQMRRGAEDAYEVLLERADGSTFTVLVRGRPIEYRGRTVQVEVLRDLTEVKKAERELRRSETDLKEAERMARLGNWVWDVQANDVYWSDEIYRIFGVAPQEFDATYEAFLGTVHPDDRKFVDDAINEALDDEKPYSIDHRIVLPDGSERVVHEEAVVARDEGGQPLRMRGTVQDITERKWREEELRQSEVIVANSSDMLALLDREYTYLAANPAYLKSFGKTHDQLVGNTVAEVFGAEFFNTVIKPNADRCLGGAEVNYAEWFDFPASGKRFMEISYYPYVGAGSEVRGFVVNARDITERKQVEDALRESEERFRNLAETSPAGITIVRGGRTRYVNPSWEAMTGYSAKEVLDSDYMERIHPDDRETVVVLERQARQYKGKHIPSPQVSRIITKDGSERWFETSASPTEFEGEPAVLAVSLDITEQKLAEDALRKSEERFRTIFEDGPLGITVRHPDGPYIDANAQACELMECTKHELVGTYPSEIVHPEDLDRWRQTTDEMLTGDKRTIRHETRLVTKRGRTIWCSIANTVVRDEDGEPIYVIAMALDITERIRDKERLGTLFEERERLVQQTLTAQEDERRKVAHDIHDGATQQIVAAGMYLDAFRRDRKHKESAEVEAELAKAKNFVDSAIEEVRRIIADLRPAALDDLGLTGALRGHVDEIVKATGKKVTLRTDLDDERLPVLVESTLFRIAQEALNNAIKHSGSERIRVSLLKTQPGLSLTVTDWGEGFDRLAAAGNGGPSERVGIIGMRERAELIGGSLHITSEIGRGTRVNARVPVQSDVHRRTAGNGQKSRS